MNKTLKGFIEGLKGIDKKYDEYLTSGGIRIKEVYKNSILEWHEPRTEIESRLWEEHEYILAKVKKTGKCPCGASVKSGSGNYLQDLGYLYGVECLNCR